MMKTIDKSKLSTQSISGVAFFVLFLLSRITISGEFSEHWHVTQTLLFDEIDENQLSFTEKNYKNWNSEPEIRILNGISEDQTEKPFQFSCSFDGAMSHSKIIELLPVKKRDNDPEKNRKMQIRRDGFPFWPIEGSVEPLAGTLKGVCITGRAGSLILAVREGTVVWAGAYRGYKDVVLVAASDSTHYFYGGCEAIYVNLGQKITAGEPVGRLVSLSNGAGAMYFTAFKDGEFIDAAKVPRG